MEELNYQMKFETLKGTRDYAFLDAKIKERVFTQLKEEFMKNGFRPFQTPHIEYIDTLTNKYDEDAEIVQEIFKVTDRGDRELGLRYDLTIPLCRFLAQNIKSLKLPYRRFHIGSAFRDGPIKKGRLREFEQCDCDVIGLKGQDVEIELMELFMRCYEKLEITGIVELNSIKILQGAFLQAGFDEKDLDSLILSVDKLKKIGKKGVLAEIKEKKLDDKKAELAVDILESQTFDEIKKKASNEVLVEGITELESLVNGCEELKLNYRVNFSMARGHNYYTGNIWEVYDTKERVTSSIGGGGRYDKGIGNYIGTDEEIPAVGISFGVVGIMEIMLQELQGEESEGVSDCLVVPLGKSLGIDAIRIAKTLQDEGKNAEVFYGYKLKKAFDYAESLGIKELVIYGMKDKENNQFIVKNLESGEEQKCLWTVKR